MDDKWGQTVGLPIGFLAIDGARCRASGSSSPRGLSRGFAALSTMPALRALGVSCRNVDDGALATLPRFPSLRELMPMDVGDAGFCRGSWPAFGS